MELGGMGKLQSLGGGASMSGPITAKAYTLLGCPKNLAVFFSVRHLYGVHQNCMATRHSAEFQNNTHKVSY
jgi:hypothetical protein